MPELIKFITSLTTWFWELVTGIAALLAIGGAVVRVVWWPGENWSKVRPWITPVALAHGAKPIPKETFRAVQNTEYPSWWHMGSQGGEPATQISAQYYLTNIASEPAYLVGCKLKPKGASETYDLRKFTHQLPDDDGNTSTTQVSVDGFVCPPITKHGEPLEAQVIFVDQFANELLGPMTIFAPR